MHSTWAWWHGPAAQSRWVGHASPGGLRRLPPGRRRLFPVNRGANGAVPGPAAGLSSRTGRMTCTVEAGVTGARLVTIAGRAFGLGTAYASAIPPAKAADGPRVPRRLVSFDPAFGWPGGLVVAELLQAPVPNRKPRRLQLCGGGWARWAGKEVEAG